LVQAGNGWRFHGAHLKICIEVIRDYKSRAAHRNPHYKAEGPIDYSKCNPLDWKESQPDWIVQHNNVIFPRL
jgi:hypothetical protein